MLAPASMFGRQHYLNYRALFVPTFILSAGQLLSELCCMELFLHLYIVVSFFKDKLTNVVSRFQLTSYCIIKYLTQTVTMQMADLC